MISNDWREALRALNEALEANEVDAVKAVVINLVSAGQIAEAYGYSQQAMAMMKSRARDFPEPITSFGKLHVYWRPQMEAWMHANHKSGGKRAQ